MSQSAKHFIEDWVRENINPEAYDPEGDTSRSQELADQCRADASAEGISNWELDAAVDDIVGGGSGLAAYIANVMEETTNAEVQRLADKDK